MKNWFKKTGLMLLPLLIVGCTSRFELTDEEDYLHRLYDYSQEGLCLGVRLDRPSYDADIIGQGITRALREQAEYRAFYQHIIRERLDVIANIKIDHDFSGSFTNFFVAFPGYLVFTHAWLGYKYYAEFDVQCELIAVVTDEVIATIDIPVEVGIRHADAGRTWSNAVIWPVAPFSLINGLYCITYDNDVTRDLRAEFYETLSNHIASEIIKVLNNQDWGTVSEDY